VSRRKRLLVRFVPLVLACLALVAGIAYVAITSATQADAATHANHTSHTNHAHRSGPAEAPGGTYFLQGTVVNFCFTHGKGGWLEFNTTALGNCPAGDVQLSLMADPDGLTPAPAATVTSTP
jgi:hypothetical protein